MAAKGRASAQIGQTAMIGKSLCANDRIMAPIIAIASRPDGEARGNDGPINTRCKLLDAGKHRVAIDDERQSLNDAGIGIGFHGSCERDNGMSRHQTVSIEHHHMRISAAPAGDKVANIASLARGVFRTMAIKDARAITKARTHRQKSALFGNPHIRIGRVGEEEPVEMRTQTRALDIFDHRLHRAEHAAWRFIIDRHGDSRALTQLRWQSRSFRRGKEQPEEAEHTARKGNGNP